MNRREAEELLVREGFKVKKLIEEDDNFFIFSCEADEDDSEIAVCVDAGQILIAPT